MFQKVQERVMVVQPMVEHLICPGVLILDRHREDKVKGSPPDCSKLTDKIEIGPRRHCQIDVGADHRQGSGAHDFPAVPVQATLLLPLALSPVREHQVKGSPPHCPKPTDDIEIGSSHCQIEFWVDQAPLLLLALAPVQAAATAVVLLVIVLHQGM